MRIGLITLYSEDNPGQFFQCLASLNMLRSLFPQAEVEIPDIQHWEQNPDPRSRRDALFMPWRNAWRVQRRKKYDRARRDNFPIRGPKLVTPDPAEAARAIAERRYDLLVVGSDAVLYLWGENVVKDNLPALHWLADVSDTPRVMMSSCSHTVRFDQLNDSQREIMSKAVKAFSFMGVRDPLTKELIAALGPAEGTPLCVSPDPTFSYEVDPAAGKAMMDRKGYRKNRPLCGLRLPWKSAFHESLVRLLRKDFDVVGLSANYRGVKPWMEAGPFEWSGFFPQVDLHVTTSFHETIFCLKQGVPVYTIEGNPSRFDPQTMKSKVYYVHEEVGTLADHYYNPFAGDLTPESVHTKILQTWQAFDGDAARTGASRMGDQYLEVAARMRETVAPLLGATV